MRSRSTASQPVTMVETLNAPSLDHAVFARGLTKTFGLIPALRGIDLELYKGEFLTIFGPNGAGKTTLIKILSTLVKPTSGSAWVAGYDVLQSDPRLRSEIGVISHVSFLYGNLSAFENILFYAKMHSLENPEDRAAEVIEEAGLKARMHDRVGTFSRGMLQRISIARAIVNDPSVLFLDEPYTGLDVHASIRLKEQLDSLHNKKRTIVMTTHDISRGLEICDRVAVLVKGKLVLMKQVQEIDVKRFENQYFDMVSNAS